MNCRGPGALTAASSSYVGSEAAGTGRQGRATWFGVGCPTGFETTHVASLQKVDVTSKAVAEVLARTIEYLQPNPGRGTS